MDASEFDDHLDRYGGDLADWPPELRLTATALMGASPKVRVAFLAMGDVEAFLRHPIVAADGMADATAARAMRHRQIRPVPVFARRMAWAAGAAAALVLGLFVGALEPPHHEENPANVMAAAFDGGGFDITGSVDVD